MPDIDARVIPRYFPGEQEAIARVLEAGAIHGYGNMIQRLSEAWSKMLQEKWGLPKDAADRAAFDPAALLKYSEQATTTRLAAAEKVVNVVRPAFSVAFDMLRLGPLELAAKYGDSFDPDDYIHLMDSAVEALAAYPPTPQTGIATQGEKQ